jgi:hypothetical protein
VSPTNPSLAPGSHENRALLVGDASGYIDALTGEGLRLGFAEAEAAVDAVVADEPERYEHAWQKATRSYRLMTGGLLWASSRRAVRPLIVPAAQAMPGVFTGIACFFRTQDGQAPSPRNDETPAGNPRGRRLLSFVSSLSELTRVGGSQNSQVPWQSSTACSFGTQNGHRLSRGDRRDGLRLGHRHLEKDGEEQT